MAWTYANWVTMERGSTQRVETLRLHVQEVSEKVTASVQAAGTATDAATVQAYLDRLMSRLDLEERAAGLDGTTGGGLSGVDLRRG